EAAESAADETEQEEGSERTGVRAAANRHLGRFPDDATIVRGGEFEGSIRIPDTDVSVRIGGLVLTELAFDIDSLGFTDVLSPRTIPLDGTEGDDTRQLALNAFNSRINFDVRSDTSLGELRVFIEADFSVAGNEFLSTNPFSLRHAIAGIGALHIGQWWSSFSDTASFPETSSLGLPGGPAIRQAGIRYAPHIGEHLQLIGSLEVPRLDVAGVEGPDAQSYVPDIVGAVALTYPWFRLRVAGLFRYLDAGDETAPAGGINASGRIPLSFITDGTNLAFQLQYGTGIARYYGALQGLGLDGIVSDNGELATVEVLAGFVAYQQWWTPKWRTQIVASLLDLRLPSSAAPETLKRVTYYAVNLFWTPLDGLTFGVEALYATREQLSGAEGSGLRLHASARFDF
ncbi:MAG: DcaP family trimeric outer membrane transporter, partial [Myxococcota bacterium]